MIVLHSMDGSLSPIVGEEPSFFGEKLYMLIRVTLKGQRICLLARFPIVELTNLDIKLDWGL